MDFKIELVFTVMERIDPLVFLLKEIHLTCSDSINIKNMKIYFLEVFSSLLAIVPEQAGTLKAGSNGCNKEKILMISRKFPHTSNNDHEAIFGD